MRELMRVTRPILAAGLLLAPELAIGGIRTSASAGSAPEARVEEAGRFGYFQLIQLAQTAPKQGPVPPMRVQVSVGTQQRRIGDSYRKAMEIKPRIILEGINKGLPLPELEAVMIIVTMDTQAKYVQKREVYRVESAQTLPIPAANRGERRDFPFEQSVVTFDSWRDQTNVGGATYKYFIFGLRDPQTKALVDFQTNNQQLATLAKSSPERREEFLGLSKGSGFPSDIK
jgi:hypothetical protein